MSRPSGINFQHKLKTTFRRFTTVDWSEQYDLLNPMISVGGGAWPFLDGGAICLLNSDNERDSGAPAK